MFCGRWFLSCNWRQICIFFNWLVNLEFRIAGTLDEHEAKMSRRPSASVFMHLVPAAQWQLCFSEIWASFPIMGSCCRPFSQHRANTWYSGGLADHTLQSDNLLFQAKEKKKKKENGCLIFHYCVFLDGKNEKKPLQPFHLKWHDAGGQIRRKQRKATRLSITRGTGVWGLHTNKRAAGGGSATFDRFVLTGWAKILHSVGRKKDVRWSQNKMGGFPDTIGCPMVGGKSWGR